MAEVARDATRVGMDAASGMFAGQVSGRVAGEAIAKGDACYIKGADGKIWKALADVEGETAYCIGLAADAAGAEEAVTVYSAPSIWDYADGTLTPGALLYLSQTTAGALDTAQTLSHPGVLAQAIDAYRIRIVKDVSLW